MDLNLWKQEKRKQKLTLAQIAEKANLPLGSVQNIFAGYVPNPRIDTVMSIEKALGLKNVYEWTEEEKALGVGRLAIYLTDDEFDWLELRSEILRTKGAEYLQTIEVMINAIITENSKKKP